VPECGRDSHAGADHHPERRFRAGECPRPEAGIAAGPDLRAGSAGGLAHACGGRHPSCARRCAGGECYRSRPRTTEDIAFLVGEEALEAHAGRFVTLRVPVIEFDGIAVDQIPIGDALRVLEEGLERAPVSDGVPIASLETIVVMKLLAGRTQDLADIEAIAGSGVDRDSLRAAVQRLVPDRAPTLERLFENADRVR
jgi:hypothetical protein